MKIATLHTLATAGNPSHDIGIGVDHVVKVELANGAPRLTMDDGSTIDLAGTFNSCVNTLNSL